MCRRLPKSEEGSEVKSCRENAPATWGGFNQEPVTRAAMMNAQGLLQQRLLAGDARGLYGGAAVLGRVEVGVKIFRDDTSPDV